MEKVEWTDTHLSLFEKQNLQCADIRKLFGDFVDNDLPQCLKDRVTDHLTSCDVCQEFEAGYRLVIQLAKKISPPSQLDDATSRRLLTHLRNRLGY